MVIDYWVVGFLWGSARFSGGYLLSQNMDKASLEKVKRACSISNKIFTTITHQGKKSYRLKIPSTNDYVKFMVRNDYKGRVGNEERNAPTGLSSENEYDFLKGYFSTHYTLDNVRNKNYTFPRLRFYASKIILEMLNKHLNNNLNTTIKKIGNHSNNNICKVLYYQSKKEVPKIIEYLNI